LANDVTSFSCICSKQELLILTIPPQIHTQVLVETCTTSHEYISIYATNVLFFYANLYTQIGIDPGSTHFVMSWLATQLV